MTAIIAMLLAVPVGYGLGLALRWPWRRRTRTVRSNPVDLRPVPKDRGPARPGGGPWPEETVGVDHGDFWEMREPGLPPYRVYLDVQGRPLSDRHLP